MTPNLSPEELRSLVAVMRELGVVQASGIILGPPPTRSADLERAAKAEKDPVAKKLLEHETEAERLREAKAAWLDESREMFAAAGDYSDEMLERLRPFPG